MSRSRAVYAHHPRVRIGAPPGTLVSDPGASPARVSVFAFGPDDFVELEEADVQAIPELRKRFPVVWVDVVGVGDAESIRSLGEVFDLHPLALEDVMNVPQRPKLKDYGEQLFQIVRMPRRGRELETEQLSLFLGHGFLVTFQEEPDDCLVPVRERIRQGRPRIRSNGADYLAYALLDAVVDSYFPVVDELGQELSELEEVVLREKEASVVERLHRIKRRLNGIWRVVIPMREVLGGMVRDDSSAVTEPVKVFLRDCVDHAHQLIELVELYRDNASGLVDLHLTMVSNRMNDIMKVLTIMATIFIPLGFIAGLYGMNFDPAVSRWNMPELAWPFGYPFAVGLMVVVALGMLLYFRRKGWL